MGNGVVTSGVLESSGRVPALAVEGGLGCLGNGRGFADQLVWFPPNRGGFGYAASPAGTAVLVS